jgi:hypothetical protein
MKRRPFSVLFLFLGALAVSCGATAEAGEEPDAGEETAPLAPQRILLGVVRPAEEARHDESWLPLLEELPSPTAATGVSFIDGGWEPESTGMFIEPTPERAATLAPLTTRPTTTVVHYEPEYREWAHALAERLGIDPDELVETAPGHAREAVTVITGTDFDHAARRIYPGGRSPVISPAELAELGYGEGTVVYVDLSGFSASLFVDGEVVKTWPVAIGKPSTPTPPGVYEIVRLKADPIWSWEGRRYPAGDPENGLGSRWIGIDLPTYGMHGTNEPDSIGTAASHGCIRSHNADIEEVFEYLSIGDTVIWAE